ncbi:cytochrome P450 [Colletotrichum navitas]|uniref:Cytochrome P450 n=1 Tax=Colletotrichum navitas TaxID=681940 RepID=A0AAD8VBC7_9PEZI|nr:cytochrome P450 [Colletotrichum navitas]KAK1598836.1 cytochrome P450 [Colletotrichum navitas]
MSTFNTTQTVAFKMALLVNLGVSHRILGMAAGKRRNSPIFQVFLVPFAKLAVVISDFREAQDILMRRKEFDRSDWTIDNLNGETPQFHINLKTGPEWKGRRRLLQNLMTSAFLSSVAAPNIYTSAANFEDMWKTKARLAGDRAFSADQDFYHAALDAVLDFRFGDSHPHRALKPQAELLTGQETQSVPAISATADPVEFPTAQPHEPIKAILAAGDLIQYITRSGLVKLAWWWTKLQPREKKLMDQRAQFVKEQTYHAIEKLQKDTDEDSEFWVMCAVDLIIHRERKFAKKKGREPIFWSSVMKDELRQDLRAAHASALAENRAPSHSEEVLRLAHTAPVMDRHPRSPHIPAGTIVLMPNIGPSYTSLSFEIDEAVRSETSKQAAKERGIRSWPADDINVYRPEWWLFTDEVAGGERYEATSGLAIPSGLGTRDCFGRKLANLELTLFVTLIIWNFELQPCAKETSTYEPLEGIKFRPKHCYVRLGDVAI